MTMNRLLLVPLLAAALVGCATRNAPKSTVYGNFVRSPIEANEKAMAADATRQIVAIYPPALNGFDLQQVPSDAFGYYLFDQLRGQGYALKEHIWVDPTKRKTKDTGSATAAPMGARVRLGYVVDLVGAPNLYRVTLLVGDQSLTRAYLAQDGSIFPAGVWMHKE